MADKIITRRTEFPDSFEFGTPGKYGILKVYFNASDKDGSETRIRNAIGLRAYFFDELAKTGVVAGG